MAPCFDQECADCNPGRLWIWGDHHQVGEMELSTAPCTQWKEFVYPESMGFALTCHAWTAIALCGTQPKYLEAVLSLHGWENRSLQCAVQRRQRVCPRSVHRRLPPRTSRAVVCSSQHSSWITAGCLIPSISTTSTSTRRICCVRSYRPPEPQIALLPEEPHVPDLSDHTVLLNHNFHFHQKNLMCQTCHANCTICDTAADVL